MQHAQPSTDRICHCATLFVVPCSAQHEHATCDTRELTFQTAMQAPDADDSDMLNGQILEVEVASLSDSIAALKARLAEVRMLKEPIHIAAWVSQSALTSMTTSAYC